MWYSVRICKRKEAAPLHPNHTDYHVDKRRFENRGSYPNIGLSASDGRVAERLKALP